MYMNIRIRNQSGNINRKVGNRRKIDKTIRLNKINRSNKNNKIYRF
jgi:hypothetical protein